MATTKRLSLNALEHILSTAALTRAVEAAEHFAATIEKFNITQLYASHGRHVRAGQIWRSNDPARIRGVRILGFAPAPWWSTQVAVKAEDLVTGRLTFIALDLFTVGPRGWTLEKESI